MGNDIDRIEQRVFRYWYEDGLAEIAAGCIFLLAGVLLLAANAAFAPPDSPLRTSLATPFLALGLIALVAFGGVGIFNAIKRVKSRVTHPRTGYVAYRRESGEYGKGLSKVTTFFLIAFFLGLAVAPPALEAKLNSAPAFAGPLLGVILVYLGYRLDLRRFYALAAVSAVAGLGAALADLGDVLGIVAYFGVMGVALALVGTAVLFTYLNRHPTSGEGA
ncbi:MAG: hypothetical protein Kow00120_16510 [Anaerolineae bacterium]